MTYGFQLRDGSGNITFSSPDAVAGVCVGVLELASADTDTLSFPDFTGRSIYAVTLHGAALFEDSITISYPGGVPTVDFDTDSSDRVVALFVE